MSDSVDWASGFIDTLGIGSSKKIDKLSEQRMHIYKLWKLAKIPQIKKKS